MTRGSTLVVILRAVDVEAELDRPGPDGRRRSAVAASAPPRRSGQRRPAARAVAAAAAPEPRRKSRRDSPGPFLLRPCVSFIGRDPPLGVQR